MAILWQSSLVPWIDANGDPYSGAKAYFFDAGTTTPQVTYTDAAFSIPHDHPVVANSSGMFPAIFLVEETSYRLRITDADDVTIHDVDNISVPTATVPEPPEGDTAAEFLYQTGDIKMAWRSASPTGYVRLNGRNIGSATSGATERANADCQNLFVFLWTQDANLSVSSGRGGSAAGDWAANKTIALPDWRGRSPLGLDSMGNSASNRVTDAQLGSDSDTLGSVGGAAAVALIEANLAAHTHGGTTGADGAHGHPTRVSNTGNNTSDTTGGFMLKADFIDAAANGGSVGSTPGNQIGVSATHTHTFTSASTGSGTAHNNLQPSVVIPFFIKL